LPRAPSAKLAPRRAVYVWKLLIIYSERADKLESNIIRLDAASYMLHRPKYFFFALASAAAALSAKVCGSIFIARVFIYLQQRAAR
jgi:hypothetical protein